jgi:uncharacterized protein (TIGR00106 family)
MKIKAYIITMITAELTIIPIGTSQTSISKYVAAALSALDKTGIKYELSGMGTIMESNNPEKLFDAVQKAHEAVFSEGADRVATSLKIDDRRDKNRTLNDKIRSVKERMS